MRFLALSALVFAGCNCSSKTAGGDGGTPGADSGAGTDAGADAGADGGSVAQLPGAPRIFFTDLVSGPSSGGQGGKGAFVTIYGNGFGATQGSSAVTIGGGAADNYPLWSSTRVTFQLGAAASSGNIAITVGGLASNAVPFTVRSGNIFFVTSTGSDTANDGSYAHPWATLPKAKNTLAAGDIAYIGVQPGDAVSQTTVDSSSSYNCALGMSVNDGTNSGTASLPKALVVYPGASATIGDPANLQRGILTPAIGGTYDYWVIAGFTLRGQVSAIELEGEATGWRIIGNDISCPNGTGLSGCVETGGSSAIKFLGNDVHDCAANVAAGAITKYYHAVYFSTDTNHVEVGWNQIRNGKTCRALQFHSSPLGGTTGMNQYDLIVHDNLIHGTVCDGINFATVDPSQGPVEAYNNVVYDVGQGPDPVDGSSDYAGIYVAGTTNTGAPGGGTVEVYNNTLYQNGSWTQNSSAGAVNNGGGNPSLTMHLRNNLVVQAAGQAYVSPSATASLVTGTNNLWFGAGAAPSGFTASVSADPLLVNAPSFDFHIADAGSPAVGAGVSVPGLQTDFDGYPRPASGPIGIGAYEVHR